MDLCSKSNGSKELKHQAPKSCWILYLKRSTLKTNCIIKQFIAACSTWDRSRVCICTHSLSKIETSYQSISDWSNYYGPHCICYCRSKVDNSNNAQPNVKLQLRRVQNGNYRTPRYNYIQGWKNRKSVIKQYNPFCPLSPSLKRLGKFSVTKFLPMLCTSSCICG